MKEQIEILKQELDKQIESNADYETILETSRKIDKLLAKYYLEQIDQIR